MRNPTNSSRTSVTIALSLACLAMTLSGTAFAGERGEANRGAKSTIVRHRPDRSTLPISGRSEVVGRGPSSSVGTPGLAAAWKDALVRLALMLDREIRF